MIEIRTILHEPLSTDEAFAYANTLACELNSSSAIDEAFWSIFSCSTVKNNLSGHRLVALLSCIKTPCTEVQRHIATLWKSQGKMLESLKITLANWKHDCSLKIHGISYLESQYIWACKIVFKSAEVEINLSSFPRKIPRYESKCIGKMEYQ
jgi:hypothetical protein